MHAQTGETLENAFKMQDADASVVKDGNVYEVKYKNNEFLISDDYQYIEKVEPYQKEEWTFNKTSQTC